MALDYKGKEGIATSIGHSPISGLINPVAGSRNAIIKRIDGNSSVNAIIENLEQAFPGVELRQDVIDFLEHANDKGWIRTC